MRTQRHNGLCGDDCAYRRLYEGSQASLADMAGKQADALNRVARLRSAIVVNIKQSFPIEFGQAEAQLSKRMSSTDDEVLLAYLSGFLALPSRRMAATPPPPAGVEDLREELEALGVAVPAGSDLSAWAGAVAAFAQAAAATAAARAAGDREAVESTSEAAPATKPGRRRTGAGSLLDGATATGFSSAEPAGGGRTEPSNAPLPRVPVLPEVAAAPEIADASSAPAGDPQGPMWDDEVPWGEEPVPTAPGALEGLFDEIPDESTRIEPEHVAQPHQSAEATPAASAHDLGDLFGDDEDLSSLFSEDLSEDADQLVEALFAADTGAPTTHAMPAPDVSPAPAHAPNAEQDERPDPASFPMPPTTAGLNAQTNGATPADTPAAAGPASPQPTSQSSGAAGGGGRGGGGSALRPELFPSTQLPKGKTRRTAKTSRVNAAPPDPRGLDVPIAQGATGADLTDEMFDRLVASVCIPRPVFISDLVAQVGSTELVAAWEQRCRDLGTSSPVRFITPKPRHRDRGALVVPHSQELRKAASEFTRSWWATCLDERRLRGAKLYEVAVLLHRFGESIISSRIEGDVVVLRVNQARGLVGVAVALESDLTPGSATRTQLADAVGELLTDRLTLVAILTYTSGGGTLEKLAAAVREESEARGWRPTAPVIASLSWDFAADGGSSALSVL